jgi:predicted nuclease of predicted toxin-antitoxin system
VAEILRNIGFAADTVADEHLSGAKDDAVAAASRSEGRILVTLDLDFANIRAYPPGDHTGIIVLRVKRQDKATVLAYVRRLAAALTLRNPDGELWILDGNRLRFRQSK